jgi:hypothetical protein
MWARSTHPHDRLPSELLRRPGGTIGGECRRNPTAVDDSLTGPSARLFAEWEAQAHALTQRRNYLCSLSINLDVLQGRIGREQYLDYIARTDEKLGLADQRRAVIF